MRRLRPRVVITLAHRLRACQHFGSFPRRSLFISSAGYAVTVRPSTLVKCAASLGRTIIQIPLARTRVESRPVQRSDLG